MGRSIIGIEYQHAWLKADLVKIDWYAIVFILPMGVRAADTITTSLVMFTLYVTFSSTTAVTGRYLWFDSVVVSLAGRDGSIEVRVFSEMGVITIFFGILC